MPVALTAAFPGLFPAVAALLLLWAAVVLLQRPLVQLLSKLPVVGEAIAGAVASAIGGLVDWARNIAASAVRPLLELLTLPIAAFAGLLTLIVTTAETLLGAVGRVAELAIGQVGALATRVTSAIASIAALSGIVDGVRATLTALQATVSAILRLDIPAAIRSAIAAAAAAASTAIAVALAPLQLGLQALQAAVPALIAAALAPLQAAYAALPDWVRAQIVAATAPLTAQLGQLGQAIDGFRTAVDAHLAQLTAVLAPVLALNLAVAFPALRTDVDVMRRTCVDPVCNVISPQLAVLEALLTGAQVALLLELVSSAVQDPEGTARQTARDVDGLVATANAVVGPVIGIRV